MSAAASDPFRHHGGGIDAAARLFPKAPFPWIDLSTGIAPWSYLIGGVDRRALQRLPSPESLTALESAAALAFGGIDADQIAAVPGSDITIRLLARLLTAPRVGIADPTYSAYRATWPDARRVSLSDADSVDLFICANPNNPDGRVIEKRQLQHLDNVRLVDEAFADAMPGESLLPERNGAVVLRSFGKFYGLAGIRLGFVVADAPLVRDLRQLLGDWPVSGMAIDIATRAYRDSVWQDKQRHRLTRAADRLSALLDRHGCEPVGRTNNFVLCREAEADRLFDHLCESGILTRPFAGSPDWLRFGLPGKEAAWKRLDRALGTWRRGK